MAPRMQVGLQLTQSHVGGEDAASETLCQSKAHCIRTVNTPDPDSVIVTLSTASSAAVTAPSVAGNSSSGFEFHASICRRGVCKPLFLSRKHAWCKFRRYVYAAPRKPPGSRLYPFSRSGSFCGGEIL